MMESLYPSFFKQVIVTGSVIVLKEEVYLYLAHCTDHTGWYKGIGQGTVGIYYFPA